MTFIISLGSDHKSQHSKPMETTQSILCVTHKKTRRVFCGTGSVDGGTNWYLVVVGTRVNIGPVLVGTVVLGGTKYNASQFV